MWQKNYSIDITWKRLAWDRYCQIKKRGEWRIVIRKGQKSSETKKAVRKVTCNLFRSFLLYNSRRNSACAGDLQTLAAQRTRVEGDMKKKSPPKRRAVVFANKMSEILRDNGFHPGPYADPPGFSYQRMHPQMAVNGKEDGEFVMHVFKDADGSLDIQVLSLVITQAYGQDFTDWIAIHLGAAVRADQAGRIGRYDIWMRVYEEKGIIRIIPHG
jgi:hypothetical protein